MNRAVQAANLSFLILYPVAWTAPLARAGLLPFFGGSELTILGALAELWRTDLLLFAVVAAFAVVAPYLKTIFLAAIHIGALDGARWSAWLEIVSKLSMADVFLLAFYIVAAKGVGVGYVETAWGLYLFTALVLGSFAMTALIKRKGGAW